MQSTTGDLSPQQVERFERFEARYPATTFDVLSVDPFSRAALVEYCDAESSGLLTVTASGRTREA